MFAAKNSTNVLKKFGDDWNVLRAACRVKDREISRRNLWTNVLKSAGIFYL